MVKTAILRRKKVKQRRKLGEGGEKEGVNRFQDLSFPFASPLLSPPPPGERYLHSAAEEWTRTKKRRECADRRGAETSSRPFRHQKAPRGEKTTLSLSQSRGAPSYLTTQEREMGVGRRGEVTQEEIYLESSETKSDDCIRMNWLKKSFSKDIIRMYILRSESSC